MGGIAECHDMAKQKEVVLILWVQSNFFENIFLCIEGTIFVCI